MYPILYPLCLCVRLLKIIFLCSVLCIFFNSVVVIESNESEVSLLDILYANRKKNRQNTYHIKFCIEFEKSI